MHTAPTIFVSYCQRSTALKDFFVTLLGDLGFRTAVFDYGSPESVIETERDLIESCDGFLALLTPEEETADGRHVCSMAVIQEIAMAYQADKPSQLFAFDGVDFSAIQASQATTVAKITSTQTKSRGISFDVGSVRQILRGLLEFKRRVDSIDAHKGEDAFLSYRRFRIEQHILSPTELRLHNTIEGVTLKNLGTHTHAARLLCDRGDGNGIELSDDNFQFKLIRPSNSSAKVRITENGYSNFRFYMDFTPPLQAGTNLKYAYRRKHFNYFPFTLEELQQVIAQEKLNNRVMASNAMIGQDFFATQPTDYLSIHLRFPAGYPISNYKALACEYRGDEIHHAETDRANDFVHIEHDEFDDVFHLRMEMPTPRVSCSYFLLYTPPAEAELR